ncbi:MAG: 6-bladed beta-propeller [Gemmatimonadota bacterium]|nr:6-bladed beta-propeller [Gemmatimonadota bacterium]
MRGGKAPVPPAMVAFLVAVSACSRTDTPTDAQTTRDSAGVTIVENPAEDVPLAWGFERVRTLGTAEAGPEGFHGLDSWSLAFDAAGRVFVLDKGNQRVVVFDGAGAFMAEVGRAGDGPDAFRFPRSIWVSPTGEVEVLDTAHRMIKTFNASAGHAGNRSVSPMALGMSGRIEATTRGIAFDGTDGLRASGDSLTGYVAYVEEADTVRIARWRRPGTTRVEFAGCRVRYYFEPFFAPEIRWDAAGDLVAVNSRLGYVVDLFEGGELRRSVRRPLTPRTVTDADVRSAAEPLTRFRFGGSGGRVCTKDLDELVAERGYATRHQLISDVVLGTDGSLWVRRGEDGEPRTDVFDPVGRYLGTLREGTPFPIAISPRGEIVTRELDAFDVEHLVFYRVRERTR